MKAIVLNTTDSSLNKRMEAVTLKAGYLLCDELYAAGNTGSELRIRETHTKFSLERKLDLLEGWCADDPRIPEMVQEVRELIKLSKKRKHKTTEEILLLKRMEKDISDMLNLKIDEIEETLDEAGFQVLRELKKERKFHSYCFGDDPEKPLEGVTASSVLQRLFPSIKEIEEPEIFFLGADFFNDDEHEVIFTDYTAPGAFDEKDTAVYSCFTFPNINALSATEIETVRSQLQKVYSAFTERINEWIDMCYFGDGITDRICFFKNEVAPLAEQIQKAIEENETLKLCSRMQDDKVKLEICFGEIPVWKLWNYYKEHNVIEYTSWQKLKDLKEAKAYENQRWPVAILRLPRETVLNTEPMHTAMEAETHIQATRKYLFID